LRHGESKTVIFLVWAGLTLFEASLLVRPRKCVITDFSRNPYILLCIVEFELPHYSFARPLELRVAE